VHVCVYSVCKQIISFDELRTDYKNPIDQCNSLNPVSGSAVVVVGIQFCTFVCFLRATAYVL